MTESVESLAGETRSPAGRARPVADLRNVGALAWTLFPVFVAVTLLILYRPSLLTNDDTLMASVSMGNFTGHPNVHTVFVGSTVSATIAFVSWVSDDVPSYGLVLYGGHAIALAVAGIVLTRYLEGTARTLGRIVVVVGVLATIVTPSYNISGILLGSAGVCVLLTAPAATHPVRACALGGCALGASYWFRQDASLAVLAFFTPAIALGLIRLPNRARLTFVVAAAVVVLISFCSNAIAYRSAEWQEYLAFNDARGQLHGNPRQGLIDDGSRESANWSVADQQLFFNWLIFDDPAYSTESLERLIEATPPPGRPPLGDRLHEIFDRYLTLLALSIVIIVYAAVTGGRRLFMVTSGYLVWFVLVGATVPPRFPHRIALPLWVGLTLVLAATLALGNGHGSLPQSPGAKRGARLFVTAAATTAALLVVGSIGPHEVSLEGRISNQQTARSLSALTTFDPDARFVLAGGAIDFAGTSPWTVEPMGSNPNIVPFGWHAGSPLMAERSANAGISDIPMAIAFDDTTYLVAPPTVAADFATWMAQRHDVRIREVSLGRLDPDNFVFTFVPEQDSRADESRLLSSSTITDGSG